MKKLVESIKVVVNTSYKPVGLAGGLKVGDEFVILPEGATEFRTKANSFSQDYTDEEWSEFKQTQAYATLRKDLARETPGIEYTSVVEDDVTIHTVTRLYPVIGPDEVSLSALLSVARAIQSQQKKPEDFPAAAVILRGRDEAAILANILAQGEKFASEKGELRGKVLDVIQYKVKTKRGETVTMKATVWAFVNLAK